MTTELTTPTQARVGHLVPRPSTQDPQAAEPVCIRCLPLNRVIDGEPVYQSEDQYSYVCAWCGKRLTESGE